MAETYVSIQPMSAEELSGLSESFESAPASAVIRWALDTFGDSIVLAASFEDIVLIDLVTKLSPSMEVVFLDTEAHFPETLTFVEEIRARYDLNLTVTRPGPDAVAHPCGSERCCEYRKVEPLRRALAGKRAWLTSLKRSDGPTRADAPIVSWDSSFGLVKVNPVVAWTDDDIASYLGDHGLPQHPLVPRGYRSIGCAPTTRPVAEGEDPRAGRWSGLDKSECGLHV
ncbi:MAG TPA: phosphoadenylyl-sulfate reductase [Acidimicrobiales bacterium]|nr:phosphoadenylyl-sulfate reductase [Acidimicrobiales bacterium]